MAKKDENPQENNTVTVAAFTVLDHLNHDHKLYEPGQKIELDEAASKPLLAVGVIAAVSQDSVIETDLNPES